MDWISIKIDGAWDIIWLLGSLVAIVTSSSFVITYIRSLLQKKTEGNRLDTIKVVQQQVDLLENQITSLTREIDRLFTSGEETRLHKIELMKSNIMLHDQINKLKKENESTTEMLKDVTEQNKLLKEQNVLLTEQVKELKSSKEFLKKEIKLLKDENIKLKTKS